jgi:tetratricopeptide (TPR) repeat protein
VSQADPDVLKMQQGLQAYGFTLLQQGRYSEAESVYTDILRRQPRHFEALHLLGIIALETNRAARGVELIEKAVKLDPRVAAAHSDLGIGLQALKLYKEALASYDRSIALQANSPQVHNNRGNVLRQLARHEQALASYDKAIALRPDYAVAHRNRGIVLRELKRHEAALGSYDKAIALQPDFAEVHRNRGLLLRDINRHEEALASFDRAIVLRPNHAATHGNRGVVLQDLARHDEALVSYNKAIELNPGDADENWNHGLCLLLLGKFERGWQQYEWRKRRDKPIANRGYVEPCWLGKENISGKTLFLYWEQGFGDTIQFGRYARLAAALGAKIVLSVQDSLVRLFSQSEPDLEVIGESRKPARFDYHCPLMSLPLAFGTTLETIPSAPRYLRAAEQCKARWDARLAPKTRPRIGIAWSGSQVHNIHNRSMDLATLLPLLSDDVQWTSLQKEISKDETEVLLRHGRVTLPGAELADFSDTAALLDLMDLVITVDTSVAHLAGAMGKPVWIMLPYNADWRWLRDRTDSPWYPSVRLFRQSALGKWDDVIHQVNVELRRWIDTSAHP